VYVEQGACAWPNLPPCHTSRLLGPARADWTVLEQRLEALYRLRRFEGALGLLGELRVQFPGSSRVARLEHMHDEALLHGKHAAQSAEKVERVLAPHLEAWSGSRLFSQRRVALARLRASRVDVEKGARGVVEALQTHVRTHTEDAAAWAQLGEQLQRLGRFLEAAFCFEECVLLTRGNAHAHVRISECVASGAPSDAGRLEGARRHAAMAVRLTRGGLPRALVVLREVTDLLASARGREDPSDGALRMRVAEGVRAIADGAAEAPEAAGGLAALLACYGRE